MNCLTNAWTLHEPELRGWARHRLGNAEDTEDLLQDLSVELPEDLASPVDDADSVDTLTACLPRVLSELNAEDRDAITLCDLQGMAQADYAIAKGLTLSAAKSRVQRARIRMKAQMTVACQVQLDGAGHVADFVPRNAL